MQQNRGTMCKSFHAGHAASSGLLSAWLAKHDFDSSEEIIEGTRGFAKIYSHSQALGRLTQGLGEDWMIETNGHKLVGWERFGTPAIDRIVATIEGPTKGSGVLVEKLVELQGARIRIRDIFPKGIPAPEGLRFQVELTPGH
jgi:2-methylcitrate dehydratase PrpD